MSFFDSKLEVIDFELTSYGKHLLSIGKLKPSYYAFYDHDILYDSQYASVSETQNNVEPRVQEETPKLKIQPIYHGAETELMNSFQGINTKNKLLFYDHIGTSKYDGNNAPTWDVKVLNNTISSSVPYLTSSFNKLINLPQINLNLNFDVYYVNPENVSVPQITLPESVTVSGFQDIPMEFFHSIEVEDQILSLTNNETKVFGPYEDGNYVFVDGKNFAIDIIENNNFDEKDSFEIEVFEYLDESEENLKQLYFFQNYANRIENNVMLDVDRVLAKIPNISITSDYVEYYFSILTDNSIPNEIVCKYIDNGTYVPKQKTKYKNLIKCNPNKVSVNPTLPIIPTQSESCDV